MGIVSNINKRVSHMDIEDHEAYDEWAKFTRMKIKELYMAIMYSEQCKAENKAAEDRITMKNAFYSDHDYAKAADREETLVADEKKFDQEIAAAITDITEVLCCQASYELGVECSADRKKQIQKLVHKAVYTILAGMYRDDTDDDDDGESYEDFIIRKMKMTKLYLGIISVELRQAVDEKPFKEWGSCIDKYALLWVKKPGVSFEESLERRAIYNDWSKEEMDSEKRKLADKDEEPAEEAHILDKYVCLWSDTPGVTYKDWVKEQKIQLKEGRWLHELSAENQVENEKKKPDEDEKKEPAEKGHIMDKYVCLWNKTPGLTYKDWLKEEEEEQQRLVGLMELEQSGADHMEEDKEPETDDFSWRTEDWKDQNEEKGADGLVEKEQEGANEAEDDDKIAESEGFSWRTYAEWASKLSDKEREKELQSVKKELEILKGCSGLTYEEWVKKEKEEEKKELLEMIEEEELSQSVLA